MLQYLIDEFRFFLIKFSDDVGWLLGQESLITFIEGEAIKVKMDLRDQIEFEVPIQHEVEVPIPSGVDLSPEISALKAISGSTSTTTVVVPIVTAP